jgi:Tol biopolymer transport system component
MSDRDGSARMYSLGQDGSALTPLFARGTRSLAPVALAPDGKTIAYIGGRDAPEFGPLYVSRADGSGLHRLAKWTHELGFSPDGTLLAFRGKRGIWIVRPDGHGLRHLTSGDDSSLAWSPSGKALVFMRVLDSDKMRYAVLVQPLRGRSRVLVRTGPNDASDARPEQYQPQWSPDGRWIAYINFENKERLNGLTLVRPNGKRRHRAAIGAGEEDAFEWSPNSRWLAYSNGPDLVFIRPNGDWHRLSRHAFGLPAWSPDRSMLVFPVIGDLVVASADGRRPKLLRLGLSGFVHDGLLWSGDSKNLVFAVSIGGDPEQIWIVGSDGRSLRRLTSEGNNAVVGWTSLAPTLPPAAPLPPTEQVAAPEAVATVKPIASLAADGSRVAFAAQPAISDCGHVSLWNVADGSLGRLGHLPAPCSYGSRHVTSPLALAGTRAAWVTLAGDGQNCSWTLESATAAEPAPRVVIRSSTSGATCNSTEIGHLHGDGDLLVFNNEPEHPSWLVRLGAGATKCGELLCTTLRSDAEGGPASSVSAGLIAVRKPATVTVFDAQGHIVRTFPFSPADVSGARLDGGHLVVARSDAIESYDVTSGTREAAQPRTAGYELADADGGIAVLRRAAVVIVTRLADGHSLTLAPGGATPVLADLEAPGLYYSYSLGDGSGRVVFVPRDELLRRLEGAS